MIGVETDTQKVLKKVTRLRFSLPQVEHFLALAEELNFTRAAGRCSIAQPPFSRSIARLEATVRAPLLVRHARGVSLTESGQAFAEAARAALAALHDAVEQASVAQRTARRLRIGMLEYAFAALGPRFIDAFAQQQSGLLVEPIDMATEHLALSLKSGTLDLQFAAFGEQNRLPVRSGLRELPILAEAMAVLVDERHRLARRRKVSLDEIARERLILFEPSRAPQVHQATLRAFAEHGLRPQIELEVGLLQTMFSAVRAIGGAGLVPFSVRHVVDAGLRVIAIDPAEAPRLRLALVWSAERESDGVRAFVDWVRARKQERAAAGDRRRAAVPARDRAASGASRITRAKAKVEI